MRDTLAHAAESPRAAQAAAADCQQRDALRAGRLEYALVSVAGRAHDGRLSAERGGEVHRVDCDMARVAVRSGVDAQDVDARAVAVPDAGGQLDRAGGI